MVQNVFTEQLTGSTLTLTSANGQSVALTASNTGSLLSGGQQVGTGGGSGVTVYANSSLLPLENLTAGDMAFANNNNTLYLTNGFGWYKIALINQNPSITANLSNVSLGADGNTAYVSYTVSEPEGTPVTVSVANSGLANTSQGNVVLYTSNNTIEINNFAAEGSEWTANVILTVSDGVNIGTSSVTVAVSYGYSNQVTYTFTAESATSFTVPVGVTEIYAKVWGAGGGGPKTTSTAGAQYGGGGGYVEGIIDTTNITTLNLYPGEGGAYGPATGATSWGFGQGAYGQGGGSGGGGSAITIASNSAVLLVAGGGGGSSARDTGYYEGDASGGAGGGTNGQDGLGASPGGGAQGATGGTSPAASAGGDAGTGLNGGGNGGNAGGGTGDAGGGGGGGGYAGGGGGGGGSATNEAGGGGGSGYYHPTLVTEAVLTAGNRQTPGNSTDSDLPSGFALGGDVGVAGGNGCIILYY